MIAAKAIRTMGESDYLLRLRDRELAGSPVEYVLIEELGDSYSPRVSGENSEHTRVLAELNTELPPIVVHRGTMKVVDGMHRLHAARMIGLDRLPVRFFDGNADDAFLLAVAINVSHGLPLSLADRTAATERILALHPDWSDRAVAAVVGLSATKVSDIRRSATGQQAWPGSRTGLDGRVRPLSTARGRELAYELMTLNPGASLRQIAQKAGISPATVADVRNRMRRGAPPVPSGHVIGTRPGTAHGGGHGKTSGPRPLAELLRISARLRRDPSLRYNEPGRLALRMFEICGAVAAEWHKIVAKVPTHCKGPMSELMYGYADMWRSFADQLREESIPAGRSR